MKSRIFATLGLSIAILACNKEKPVVVSTSKIAPVLKSSSRLSPLPANAGSSRFISTELANTMISSYLYSINSTQNDSDVRSFTVNADSLRAFLQNISVKNVKLIFAHTKNYIDSGYTGKYAGYQSGALTIIIAAYDTAGNYIYYAGNVLDHLAPCPFSCPSGTAGNDLLQ
jgi:hypothetical protein